MGSELSMSEQTFVSYRHTYTCELVKYYILFGFVVNNNLRACMCATSIVYLNAS
jgi:hypothetical protein